jgi:dihydroneopterin aldolase
MDNRSRSQVNMTRHQKIACTFLLFIFTFVSVAQEKQKYLDQRQLDAVADQLIANFERLDAISIDVRDRSRSVKWDTYKNWLRTSISQAINWTDFVLSIDSFHYEITNLHSYVEVAKEIRTFSQKEGHHGLLSHLAIPTHN